MCYVKIFLLRFSFFVLQYIQKNCPYFQRLKKNFVTLALFSLLWRLLLLVYPWKGKVHNYIFEIVSGFAEKVPTSVILPNFQTSYIPT